MSEFKWFTEEMAEKMSEQGAYYDTLQAYIIECQDRIVQLERKIEILKELEGRSGQEYAIILWRIEELKRKIRLDDICIKLQREQLVEKDALLAEAIDFIESGIDEDIEGWHIWESRARRFVAKVRGNNGT